MYSTVQYSIFGIFADEIILGYIMIGIVAVLMASIVVNIHYQCNFPKPKLLVLTVQILQKFVSMLSKKKTDDKPENVDQVHGDAVKVIDGVKLASRLNVYFFWILLLAVIVFGVYNYYRF